MEERIIDDEYGRGIKLKKTKDGYVDVTDGLAEDTEDEAYEGDEVEFAFPVFDGEEYDEELIGLTPEEIAEVKRQRAEAQAKRRAEYEQCVQEAQALLADKSYKSAAAKFEKALALDEEATEASVGYWESKTEEFAHPDLFVEEYLDAGIESMEFDVGYKAMDILREKYRGVLETRRNALSDEEKPLAAEVEGKQEKRRAAIKERLKRSGLWFAVSLVPTVALAVLAVVFGLKNFTTRENTFVVPTIICGVAFVAVFIAFLFLANKFINDLRIRRVNERLSSTDEGERLEELRTYIHLYDDILAVQTVAEEAIEAAKEE